MSGWVDGWVGWMGGLGEWVVWVNGWVVCGWVAHACMHTHMLIMLISIVNGCLDWVGRYVVGWEMDGWRSLH